MFLPNEVILKRAISHGTFKDQGILTDSRRFIVRGVTDLPDTFPFNN